MKRERKTRQAPWVGAFGKPKRTAASVLGCAPRSEVGRLRHGVYMGILDLFLATHPYCTARCEGRGPLAKDVHHKRGRDGLLLFDVRYFMAVCRRCHNWIGAHPREAIACGWNEPRNK